MRLSRKSIYARFDRFCESVSLKRASFKDGGADVGSVYLDFNAIYGGWDVCQIVNSGRAVRSLNGSRLSSRELDAFFSGAIFAAEIRAPAILNSSTIVTLETTENRL